MKTLIGLILVLILISGCSKDNPVSSSSSPGTLIYSHDGIVDSAVTFSEPYNFHNGVLTGFNTDSNAVYTYSFKYKCTETDTSATLQIWNRKVGYVYLKGFPPTNGYVDIAEESVSNTTFQDLFYVIGVQKPNSKLVIKDLYIYKK
jgi:hypothetical protein